MKDFLKLAATAATLLIVVVMAVGFRVAAFAPDIVARITHAGPAAAAPPATAAAASKEGAT